MVIASDKAGDTVLADKITKSVKKDLEQQVEYINNLNERKQENMQYEAEEAKRLLMGIQQIEQQFKAPKIALPENPGTIISPPVTPAKAADTPK